MKIVSDSWNGSERLWKVFWIYNFLLGGLISLGIDGVESLGSELIFWIYILLVLVWGVWVTVALWKCAFNAGWRGWGYIVRTLVILGFVIIGIGVFSATGKSKTI